MLRVSFAKTPSMPTYLTCWTVGRFDHVEGQNADGIPVRLFTPVGKREEGRFGLQVAIKALDYYKVREKNRLP